MPDSLVELEAQLQNALSPQQRVDALNALATALSTKEATHCRDLAQEALALSQEIRYPLGLAQSEYTLGKLAIRQGKHDQALPHFTRALGHYEMVGDRERISSTLTTLGFFHYSLGDYSNAQQFYWRALEQAQGVSQAQESYAWNNAAICCSEMRDYDTALQYLLKSVALARQAQHPSCLSCALDSLADLSLRMQQPAQALPYALESVALERELETDFDSHLGEFLITLGSVYLALEDYAQAHEYFQEAAQTREGVTCNRRIAKAWRLRGKASRQQGDLAAALEAHQRACEYATTLDAPPLLAECLLELSQTYKQRGEFAQALETHERFHTLWESIFNERADMRFKTLQVIHQVETAEKEAELYQLRNGELQREIAQREKVQNALEELATQDPLTGLYNRRHFFHLAEQQFTHAHHNRQACSLLLLDVDTFKQINDTYGHLVGDRALKVIATRICQELRASDIAARYAGDEFILLLPGVGREVALRVAERLRRHTEALPVEIEAGTLRVTLSIGVAEIAATDTQVDQAVERADHALYAAKQAGRNTIRPWTPPADTPPQGSGETLSLALPTGG